MSAERRSVVRWALVSLALVGLALPARIADACPSHSPNAAAPEMVRTSEDRSGVGVSVDAGYSVEEYGGAGTRHLVTQRTLGIGATFSGSDRWMAAIRLPFVSRRLELASGPDLTLAEGTNFGDVDTAGSLRMRAAPDHELRALVAMRWPTAPLVRDQNGDPVDPDVQPGTGSLVPALGVGWRMRAGSGALRVDVLGAQPLPGRHDYQVGRWFRGTIGGAWNATPALALGLDAVTLVEQAGRIGGDREPDSGGTVVHAEPTITVRPVARMSVVARGILPLVDALDGDQRPQIGANLLVGWEFGRLRGGEPAGDIVARR